MCLSVHHIALPTLTVNRQADPSQTTGLRVAFIMEVNRRFRTITRLVTKSIVDEDVFGIATPQGTISVQQGTTPGYRRFAFTQSHQKVSAFMTWFNKQVNNEILDVANIEQVGSGINAAWTNKYVNSSYRKGVQRARGQLRTEGLDIPSIAASGGMDAVMMIPMHLDRLGVLYTRTFSELKGITNAMDQQISRVLTEGIASGLNPRTLARQLNQAITGINRSLEVTDSLGRSISPQRRALLLARTEVIRAHALGQLQEFRNWGIEGVHVQAELRTAGDDRVCSQCASLEGNTYTMEEAERIIPVHPQCRCIWIPSIPGQEKKVAVPTSIEGDLVSDSFKDKADAVVYQQFKKKYANSIKSVLDTMSAEDKAFLRDRIKYARNGGTTVEGSKIEEMLNKFITGDDNTEWMKSMLEGWQGSTDGVKQMGIKYWAAELEKNIPQMVFNEYSRRYEISEFIEAVSKERYLAIRAYGQAWLEAMPSAEDLILYRGTDGQIGKQLSKTIVNDITEKNLVRTSFTVVDNSLVGYTSEEYTAGSFGARKGGIEIRNAFKSNEILLPVDMLSGITGRYSTEYEFICVGVDKPIKFVDLKFAVKYRKYTNGDYTVANLVKDFGETYEQFKERVKDLGKLDLL